MRKSEVKEYCHIRIEKVGKRPYVVMISKIFGVLVTRNFLICYLSHFINKLIVALM